MRFYCNAYKDEFKKVLRIMALKKERPTTSMLKECKQRKNEEDVRFHNNPQHKTMNRFGGSTKQKGCV